MGNKCVYVATECYYRVNDTLRQVVGIRQDTEWIKLRNWLQIRKQRCVQNGKCNFRHFCAAVWGSDPVGYAPSHSSRSCCFIHSHFWNTQGPLVNLVAKRRDVLCFSNVITRVQVSVYLPYNHAIEAEYLCSSNRRCAYQHTIIVLIWRVHLA